MGAVYEAWDREGGRPVALKTLVHSTPATIYLLKQEFRTLCDLSHPNLVRLHELVMTDSEHIFFAMELVRGMDFLHYVCKPGMRVSSTPPSRAPEKEESHTRIADGGGPSERTQDLVEAERADAREVRRQSPADLGRLRFALSQLVDGVMALHAANKLHCDIKPSNVLVTPEGRIVLLDFGVATEFSHVIDEEMREESVVAGTARYMAPEQAFEPPTPACDWYSVGVMVYEALVGHAPFAGTNVDVLTMKNTIDPLPPGQCVDGVPPELDALCIALLQREPRMRPDGSEILKRLATAQSMPPRPRAPAAGPDLGEARRHVQLTGRETHLGALEDAFDAAAAGRCITARVAGRPGMGKSSLVNRFLDGLVERGAAVVLRGRAYEREAVPYKALDSVVDALSRYLICMNDEDLSLALPADAWALARLFPVLRRVPAIGALREQPIIDPHRVRRRAFLALRELFSALSRRRPIVLFVDDAQWGDADSAILWLELVRPPSAPPLLLVMTYRDEEAGASPFLRELFAHWPERAEVRDLTVGPLEQEDARHLALALIGSSRESVKTVAAAIARESAGNPFLVEELAHSVSARGPSTASTAVDFASVTLEQMVHERLVRLPAEARLMVEIVAVSGRPLPTSVAGIAAHVERPTDEMIALLRANRFLRVGIRDGREVLEPVHARIGETILGQLGSDTVREHHARLAEVLEAMPEVDVEALVTHLLGAGETTRAAQFAERAAEAAAGKLAFDEAARMLQVTIATHPASSADGSRLRKRLGEVLEWAGKSAEAGDVYLDAAEGAPSAESKADLQRAAAEQLYLSGRMLEATRALYQVLGAVGRKAPSTRWAALFWLVFYYSWIRVVGLRFRERDANEVSAGDRRRIEALYAVTIGLANVDFMRCMSMRARVLVDSLRYGDRLQVARSAAVVALDLAGNGPETGTERALWDIARRLADKEQDLAAKMAVRVTTGITSFMRGRWKEAKEALAPAASMVTNRRFALQNAALFAVYSSYFLGELKELTERYTRYMADAEESGNVFMSANLRVIAAVPVSLAADDPDRARRELQKAVEWSEGKFSAKFRMTISETELDLYVGDGAGAYQRVKGLSRALRKNFYLRLHYVRGLTLYAQGRAAIASLNCLPANSRGSRLAEAWRFRQRLERERMPWTDALAAILEAGAASAVDDRETAAAALRSAIERARAVDMSLHGAAARHQMGLLLGGGEGANQVREAEDAMTACGIRAPARFAAMLVPGQWPLRAH
jgi:hypothetical protein